MRLLITFFIVFTINLCFAQQSDTIPKNRESDNPDNIQEIKKKISKADIHIKNGDYNNALSNLKEAVQLFPNNAEVHFKMGLCYFNLNNDSIALVEFENAFKIGGSALSEINYYLGVTKHLNGFYGDALSFYQTEKEKAVLQSDMGHVKKIEKRITECLSGKELLSQKDTTIQLYNIGDSINSSFEESSMSFASDSLVFITSTKPTKNGAVSENIYYSNKNNGKWTKITDIGKPINTLGNDAVLSFDNKVQRLFLYADVNGGDIYVSDKKEALWTKPLPFSDSINSTQMESSLCFTPDSKVVYFISNGHGSMGGKDIFYSVKQESGWSNPLNIGSVINSEFDEESPFLLGDTLYFSSKGHTSSGGFDVFKSYKRNGSWVNPINLGFPVNSPYDELSFTVFNNLKYVITDRPGGKGETDIYEIDLIENRRVKKVLVNEVLVLNDSSKSTISVLNDTLASINKPQQVALALNDSIKTVKNLEKNLSDTFNTLQSGESIEPIGLLGLKPVLFKFDKYSLSADSKKSLDSIIKCVKQYPDLRMEIRVFSDCRGSSTYNKQLSDKRASTIKEYIRKKNSSVAKRTRILSLGEKNPLIDCNCDGRSNNQNKCSVSEHTQNRRAEIILTSNTSENKSKSFTRVTGDTLSGMSKSIKIGYYVVLKSERTEEDARRVLNTMRRKNPKLNLIITQNSRRSWFHICVDGTYSKEVALKEASHYKELGFSGAWYLYFD